MAVWTANSDLFTPQKIKKSDFSDLNDDAAFYSTFMWLMWDIGHNSAPEEAGLDVNYGWKKLRKND